MQNNTLKRILQVAIVSGVLIAAVGCGNAKTVKGTLGGTSQLDTGDFDMTDIHNKLDTMEVEFFTVNQELLALDLQNPLNLIGNGLKDSVKKFSGVIGDIHSKVEELKLKINTQIATLDPKDPRQQKIIVKLQEALTYLDKISTHLDEVVAQLESKINTLFAKLERKIKDKLSGIQEILAKAALGKLQDSVLKHLIGA